MDELSQGNGMIEEADDVTDGVADEAGKGAPLTLGENETVDIITGKRIPLKGNEEVRQRILSALYTEYGFRLDDMARNFPIEVFSVGQRKATKKADIAIFAPESDHTMANLRRVVICKPAPKETRTVTKIRTHQQADKDLARIRVSTTRPTNCCSPSVIRTDAPCRSS